MSDREQEEKRTDLSLALRIDQACQEFEAAWRSARPHTIEEVLQRTEEADHAALFQELLPLELELRQETGVLPTPEEYTTRFPHYGNLVVEAFAENTHFDVSIHPTNQTRVIESAPGGSVPHESLASLSRDWPSLPGYRILGELGRGGMGIVYRAEEVALNRLVALKVLSRSTRHNARHERRFEREARAAARLHHTNIVPVFGVGNHHGIRFYAMQLIHGQGLDGVIRKVALAWEEGKPRRPLSLLALTPPLAGPPTSDPLEAAPDVSGPGSGNALAAPAYEVALESSDPQRTSLAIAAGRVQPAHDSKTDCAVALPPPASAPDKPSAVAADWKQLSYWQWAARIGVQAASALDYAHRQGVLHRDIKPSNLLLDQYGTIWVADFGLAKTRDQDDLTATGDVLGTLRYMPPEALQGRADPRGDIYALGLTLYELLALRPAFDESDPHVLIQQLATREAVRLERLDPAIPRDLVTIVHKAIERDPRHRYETAGDLAADLQRFVDDEPIRARRMDALEKLDRWVRRNRAVAALSTLVLLSLLVGTAVSVYFAFEANERAGKEEAAAAAARDSEGKARRAETQALAAKRQSDLQAAHLQFKQALRQAEAGEVDVGLFNLIEALRLTPADTTDPDPPRLETPWRSNDFRRVILLNFDAWRRQLPILLYAVQLWDSQNKENTWFQAVGPDGTTFAAWQLDQPLQFRASATGEITAPGWKMDQEEIPLALSLDGKWLATRVGPVDVCSIRLREFPSGRVAGPLCAVPSLAPKAARPHYMSFVLEPHCVMTGGINTAPLGGPRRFWDLLEGKALPLQLPATGAVGYRLVRALDNKPVAVLFPHGEQSPRGDPLLAEFWDVQSGKKPTQPLRLASGLDPRVDRAGRVLLSLERDELSDLGRQEGPVRWWDVQTGRLLESWEPRRRSGFSMLTADSQTLITMGTDDRMRLYDLDTGYQRGGDFHLPIATLSGFPARGMVPTEPVLLIQMSDGGLLRAWDTRTLRWQVTAAANPRSQRTATASAPWRFGAAVINPAGTAAFLATNDERGYSRLTDVFTSLAVGPPLLQPHLHHVSFSPDGKLLAAAPYKFWGEGAPPILYLLNAATGRPHLPPIEMGTYIHALAFSPDSKLLAIGGLKQITLLDTETGQVRCHLRQKTVAASVAFSPDGKVLAVAYRGGWGGDGAGVRLWDVATGEPQGDFQPLSGQPALPHIHFIDQGRTVLVFDPSGPAVRLFDPQTGRPRALDTDSGKLPSGRITAVAVNPATPRIAVSYANGTVVQWDVNTGKPFGETMNQQHPVVAMQYSLDAHLLAITCNDNAVRLWDGPTGQPLGPPLLHTAGVLATRFTPDGQHLLTVSAAGETRRWNMPRLVPDDLEALELWLHAGAGRKRADGETVLLDLAAWQESCVRLRERWPEADLERQSGAVRARTPDSAWHDERARTAETTRNAFATLWHLDRLARLRPNDWHVHARRGAALAGAEELISASAAYDAAARHGGGEALRDWYAHAAAQAALEGRAALARWYQERLNAAPR